MIRISKFVLALLAATYGVAYAGSVSLMSVSDSISASVEAISNGSSAVSKSSAKGVGLAQGNYKVTEVAQADGGRVRVTLYPTDEARAEEGYYLYVRAADAANAKVQVGGVVLAKARPYGVAVFGDNQTSPFALLLDAQWRQQVMPEAITG